MATLTHEQQSLVGAIVRTGMSALGTRLAGVVGIHFYNHTADTDCLVGKVAVQFGKGPLATSTREFLCRLIETFVKNADDYAVDTSETSQILLACRDLLTTCTAFAPRSRELAGALYKIMAKNKNISSGDLLAIAAHGNKGPALSSFPG